MNLAGASDPPNQFSPEQVEELFRLERGRICKRTDRLIALIMCIQWPAAVAIAAWIAPYAGLGRTDSVYAHILIAIYLGGLITVLPVAMAFLRPGKILTRHVIAVCQVLMSGLFIHITGGRIEAHFHIFGSLALLAIYLDLPVLLTGTFVAIVNSVAFGHFSPLDIFGSAAAGGWREVPRLLQLPVFTGFLGAFCVRSLAALKRNAKREASYLYQVVHDPLTGLGNHVLLEKAISDLTSGAIPSPMPFALIAMNLDQFKEVNDTLGHAVGDELLCHVSRRIQRRIGPEDTLFRRGGDGFAIVNPRCSSVVEAEELAKRLVDCIREPFECGGHIIGVGTSIGISIHPDAGSSAPALLRDADLALFRAKKVGRNGYKVFDKGMREKTLRQISIEHRLRRAVETGDFEIHYQPLVSIKGSLLGFEALLRWTDAVHGRIPPSDFIPIAENTGLIIPLGKWVLENACAQAAQWHRKGYLKAKISVNVSSTQLAQTDFVDTVLNTLKETGLPPELLDLELTESIIIQNFEQTREKLAFLREVGVRLSIDDFGTGYSSLSYLRELRVDTIKIDRSLVMDIENSSEARLLIEGIIGMTHALDLKVLAEGVENCEQLEVLSQSGCDEIQGYFFSRPVPVEDASLMVIGSTCDIAAHKKLQTAIHNSEVLQVAVT